jgi:hypothetical protein
MDAMRHLAKQVILTLEKMNETYWIDHGTLLGAVRHQDLLPHDYDVDFGRVHSKTDYTKGTEFHRLLDRHGDGIAGNLMMAYMDYGPRNASRVTCDMFRYDVVTRNSVKYLQEYWPPWHKTGLIDKLKNMISEQVLPTDLFLPTVRIPFLGMMVRAPARYKEVIRRRYPYTWLIRFPYKWKCWVPFFNQ